MRTAPRRIKLGAVGIAASFVAGVASMIIPAAPPAVAEPLAETVLVDSRSRVGSSTVAPLETGKTYSFTVSGEYGWGRLGANTGTGRADAECGTIPPSTVFQRNPFALLEPGGDLLDLYVDGQNVEWEAEDADAMGCSTTHVYRLIWKATTTAPVRFSVHERGYNDNTGGFTVQVKELTEVQVETLRLFTNDVPNRATVRSTTSLSPTKTYRFTIAGSYTFGGVPMGTHDAECMYVPPAPGTRDASTVITPTTLDDDPLDVYVNGRPVDWQATIPSKVGCNDVDHTYTLLFSPATVSPVAFSVKDSNFRDNAGAFDINITEVLPEAAKPALDLPLPEISLNEEVEVNSASKTGANSAVPFRAGDSYLLEVRGTYNYGGGIADAECSNATGDPVFLPDRYATVNPATDTLDVLINSESIEWVPTKGNPDGCNVENHTYRHQFTAEKSGSVNFRVADPYTRDNSGVLKVRIYRIDEIPLGTIAVSANSSAGANTPPLLSGQRYRMHAAGVYSYAFTNGSLADAECARKPDQPLFVPDAYPTPGQDLLDVYLNNAPVSWAPASGVVGCDPDHEYVMNHTPVAPGLANLKVKDSGYRDNTGSVDISLFMKV